MLCRTLSAIHSLLCFDAPGIKIVIANITYLFRPNYENYGLRVNLYSYLTFVVNLQNFSFVDNIKIQHLNSSISI